jgi:hypothetical protein
MGHHQKQAVYEASNRRCIMSRIPHPVRLEGKLVRLEPLAEKHFAELLKAGAHQEIWAHLPLDGTDEQKLTTELKNALLHRNSGSQYPFVIIALHDQTLLVL